MGYIIHQLLLSRSINNHILFFANINVSKVFRYTFVYLSRAFVLFTIRSSPSVFFFSHSSKIFLCAHGVMLNEPM